MNTREWRADGSIRFERELGRLMVQRLRTRGTLTWAAWSGPNGLTKRDGKTRWFKTAESAMRAAEKYLGADSEWNYGGNH